MTARPSGTKRFVWIAVGVVVALVAMAIVRSAVTSDTTLAGVSLGMDPDEVQRSFVPPVDGFFLVGHHGGEPELSWQPVMASDSAPRAVRFRFEDRGLVEVVARFPEGTALTDVRAWAGDAADDGSYREGVLTVSR